MLHDLFRGDTAGICREYAGFVSGFDFSNAFGERLGGHFQFLVDLTFGFFAKQNGSGEDLCLLQVSRGLLFESNFCQLTSSDVVFCYLAFYYADGFFDAAFLAERTGYPFGVAAEGIIFQNVLCCVTHGDHIIFMKDRTAF